MKLRPSLTLSTAAMVAMILIAYSHAPRNGTIWDDDVYLTSRNVSTVEGLSRIWKEPTSRSHPYYPLTHTIFWIENRVFGFNPFVHHMTNILLHVFNSLMLWGILRTLKVRGAWIAGLIWGVHPVCVESAGWIAERKNLLSVFFYLAATLTFLKFRRVVDNEEAALGQRKLYYASLFLFLCSLLSKTAFCTLPIGLLLILWWKTGRIRTVDIRLMIPYFLLALLLGSLTIYLEKTHTGAQGPAFEITVHERLLIAGRAFWFYIGKILFPYEVNFMYERWRVDTGNWTHYIYPFAMLLLFAFTWAFRNRIGRGPLTGILFFLITLLPAIGLVNHYLMRYTFVADHLQYLPMVGILVPAVIIVEKYAASKLSRPAHFISWGVVVVVLSVLTWKQTLAYQDHLTLYNDILRKNPSCWMAFGNRGLLLTQLGRRDQAIIDLNRAIQLNPNFEEAYVSRGHFYFQQGHYDQALADFEHAIKINPSFAEAYRNRGAIQFVRKKYDFAFADFNRALYLNPEFPRAYNARGVVFSVTRRFDLALKDYNRAIKLDPEYGSAYLNRSRTLLEMRRYDLALQDALRAQSLRTPGASEFLHVVEAQVPHATR